MSEVKYTGYTEMELTDEQYNEIYSSGLLKGYLFKENEYLIAKNEEGEIVDKFIMKHGHFERVPF